MNVQNEPARTISRLLAALNAHDLEAVACFDNNYKSDQPVHPGREFSGREQVRKNWAVIFDTMPDLQADLLMLSSDETKRGLNRGMQRKLMDRDSIGADSACLESRLSGSFGVACISSH
jgi:hypothetical protein